MTDQLGWRFNPPYLVGVYLAVNAVRDIALLVDGPTCGFTKAQHIHGRHDHGSTLLAVDGRHRIHHTGVDVSSIASDIEARLLRSIGLAVAEPDLAALLVSSLPMCTLAGTDYERLLARARKQTAVPLHLVPSRSLSDDWLGGYKAVLELLAGELELPPPDPRPGQVAMIGYLMDRNEGDHIGNLAELERMLGGLGLELLPPWLCGEPLERLKTVHRASALIALPHGRAAAELLGRRLGLPVVDAGLPFGLGRTRRWIETVGQALGCLDRAHEFCEAELARCAPRLERSVSQVFLERSFVFAGDPHYAAPLTELIEELGGTMRALLLTGSRSHLTDEEATALERCPTLRFEPREPEVQAAWRDGLAEEADMLLASTAGLELLRPRQAWLEWGYPSHFAHALADTPFLGFEGCLHFVSRLAEAMGRHAAMSRPD